MKCSLFIFSVVLMSFTFKSDNNLLYQKALLNHFSKTNTDTIYILKGFDIEIPSKVGKYTIIDISDNTKSFIVNKPSLYAVKLMPIEMNNGIIEITLIDYVIKIDGSEVLLYNNGSAVYSYKYEIRKKKYMFLRKESHAI